MHSRQERIYRKISRLLVETQDVKTELISRVEVQICVSGVIRKIVVPVSF